MATPAAPPRTERTTLSVSDWRIRRLREAPSARRTDVCARRAVPRAINRLAIFAHAISNTRQHTMSRIRRLSLYPSFISPTPAPAGMTLIFCLGAMALICGRYSLNASPTKSVTSHCRRSPEKRAARPSVLAPGRRRPITRSHEFVCFRGEFTPVNCGSCCKGIHSCGGSLRNVSP